MTYNSKELVLVDDCMFEDCQAHLEEYGDVGLHGLVICTNCNRIQIDEGNY